MNQQILKELQGLRSEVNKLRTGNAIVDDHVKAHHIVSRRDAALTSNVIALLFIAVFSALAVGYVHLNGEVISSNRYLAGQVKDAAAPLASKDYVGQQVATINGSIQTLGAQIHGQFDLLNQRLDMMGAPRAPATTSTGSH